MFGGLNEKKRKGMEYTGLVNDAGYFKDILALAVVAECSVSSRLWQRCCMCEKLCNGDHEV
jgi:hypothetical protein